MKVKAAVACQLPIDRSSEAFDLMHRGESIRSVALF
jgi:Zn-dependent alcohol dehydrogenase